MRSLKLTVAYDGTAYCGWQFQRNGPSVQGTLERVIFRITGENIRVTASGRTDAGVHALGQVVGFRTRSTLAPEVLQRAFNAFLPHDVRVIEVRDDPLDLDPIRDSISKRYRYVIQDGGLLDLFQRHYLWYWPVRLDEQAMNQAAQLLSGTHDFAAFQSAGSPRATTVRTVHEFSVSRNSPQAPGKLVFEICADGFLYNMVRNLVGTLLEIGRGDRPAGWVLEVLASQDRTRAGRTAPPQGLFLVAVNYPTSRPETKPQETTDAIRDP
jgi:tRNA pseudouridine38-40 synthase